jgi:hypothetical protein
MTSGGARPRESCASGGRQGAGVVQAALASGGGGGIGGEAGQATRQGREAQRGHWATMGEGVC